jgi:hypothetical protein
MITYSSTPKKAIAFRLSDAYAADPAMRVSGRGFRSKRGRMIILIQRCWMLIIHSREKPISPFMKKARDRRQEISGHDLYQ